MSEALFDLPGFVGAHIFCIRCAAEQEYGKQRDPYRETVSVGRGLEYERPLESAPIAHVTLECGHDRWVHVEVLAASMNGPLHGYAVTGEMSSGSARPVYERGEEAL